MSSQVFNTFNEITTNIYKRSSELYNLQAKVRGPITTITMQITTDKLLKMLMISAIIDGLKKNLPGTENNTSINGCIEKIKKFLELCIVSTSFGFVSKETIVKFIFNNTVRNNTLQIDVKNKGIETLKKTDPFQCNPKIKKAFIQIFTNEPFILSQGRRFKENYSRIAPDFNINKSNPDFNKMNNTTSAVYDRSLNWYQIQVKNSDNEIKFKFLITATLLPKTEMIAAIIDGLKFNVNKIFTQINETIKKSINVSINSIKASLNKNIPFTTSFMTGSKEFVLNGTTMEFIFNKNQYVHETYIKIIIGKKEKEIDTIMTRIDVGNFLLEAFLKIFTESCCSNSRLTSGLILKNSEGFKRNIKRIRKTP